MKVWDPFFQKAKETVVKGTYNFIIYLYIGQCQFKKQRSEYLSCMSNRLNYTICILWLAPGVCPSSWPEETSTAGLRKVGRREDPIPKGSTPGPGIIIASIDPHRALGGPTCLLSLFLTNHLT